MKKRVKLLMLFMCCMFAFSSSYVGAEAKIVDKAAVSSRTQKSWCGIKVYYLSFSGLYKSDGSKITSKGTVTKQVCSYALWQHRNESALWLSNSTSSCVAGRTMAEFVLGVILKDNALGVQDLYDWVIAYGLP